MMSDPPYHTIHKDDKVSLWDIILKNNALECEKYLQSIAEAEYNDNINIMYKILDQRVNSSSRFKFYNPVIGSHGYYHILTENDNFIPYLTPNSTPLHYAVDLKSYNVIPVLLKYCSDLTLVDEKDRTAFFMARQANDQQILKAFKDHQANLLLQRRNVYQLEALNRKLKAEHAQAIALLADVDKDREAYKSKLREATTKACNFIVSVCNDKLANLGRFTEIPAEIASQPSVLVSTSQPTVDEHDNHL